MEKGGACRAAFRFLLCGGGERLFRRLHHGRDIPGVITRALVIAFLIGFADLFAEVAVGHACALGRAKLILDGGALRENLGEPVAVVAVAFVEAESLFV